MNSASHAPQSVRTSPGNAVSKWRTTVVFPMPASPHTSTISPAAARGSRQRVVECRERTLPLEQRVRGRWSRVHPAPAAKSAQPRLRSDARATRRSSMAVIETNPNLGAEIVEDAKEFVLYSWSVQNAINPIPVAGAEGRYFWDYDGKRYLDFASQLVNVNIGHQHPKIIAAIKEQADKLCTIGPPMANESRSRLGRLLAEVTPGDLSMSFFTNSGAEANENAIKLARLYTGRHKIIARYRSYHGATHGVDLAHRRPAALAERAGDAGPRADARPVPVSLLRGPPGSVPRVHRRAAPRGDPRVRGPAERRRRLPRDGDGNERGAAASGRLSPGDPRGLRPARDPARPRRGHGRLRTNRPLVRVRELGRRPGHHHRGEGDQLGLRARSAR